MRKVYGTTIRFDARQDLAVSRCVEDWLATLAARHGLRSLPPNTSWDDATAALPNLAISSRTASANDRTVTDFSADETARGGLGVLWRTEISTLRGPGDLVCDVRLYVASAEFRVVPLRADIRPPRVVHSLLGVSGAAVCDLPMVPDALPFSRTEAPALVRALLAPERKLPVLVVAPQTRGEPNAIRASSLAERLCGIAVVAEIVDPEATFTLSSELGLRLSCYDGGVRVYWPGFRADEDPYRHPLYLRRYIEGIGSEEALRRIADHVREVAAFRHLEPNEFILCRDLAAGEAKRRAVADAAEANDVEAILRQNLERGEEISRLRAALREARAEASDLRANISALVQHRPHENEELGAPGQVVPNPEPRTVAEAAASASQDFANLTFTDECLDRVKSCAFRNVRKAWAIFEAISETAAQLGDLKGSGNVDADLLFRERGFKYAGFISSSTRNKFGNEYLFNVNGARRMVEPHITVGQGNPEHCLSVYFEIDAVAGTAVVAYVGRHLRTTRFNN